MAVPDALLDSNVIIAMVAAEHQHHIASVALLLPPNGRRFAVAAHSYAEAYKTLTSCGAASRFRWSASVARSALESVAEATILLGLSAPQTFDTVRSYAEGGGTGPRLYDRLIGEVAVHHLIPCIVTWNVGHMRDLFPAMQVVDPITAVRG